MNESFEVETVLREVLEVLRKHLIPVEIVSLNVSLLDAGFDEHIPQLRTYKAGVLNQQDTTNDLVDDFVAVITAMAERIYGRRRAKQRVACLRKCVEADHADEAGL